MPNPYTPGSQEGLPLHARNRLPVMSHEAAGKVVMIDAADARRLLRLQRE